jgi:hypothetical protein
MVPVVTGNSPTQPVSLPQTRDGSAYLARISVIPAPYILAQISAKGSHIPYVRCCHRVGGLCKHLVTFLKDGRLRNVGKFGKSANLQSVAILPDVIETGNRLYIDDGFRIVKKMLSFEGGEQVCPSGIKYGLALVSPQELANFV